MEWFKKNGVSIEWKQELATSCHLLCYLGVRLGHALNVKFFVVVLCTFVLYVFLITFLRLF